MEEERKLLLVRGAGLGAVGLPIWALCESEQAQKKDSLKNEGP